MNRVKGPGDGARDRRPIAIPFPSGEPFGMSEAQWICGQCKREIPYPRTRCACRTAAAEAGAGLTRALFCVALALGGLILAIANLG